MLPEWLKDTGQAVVLLYVVFLITQQLAGVAKVWLAKAKPEAAFRVPIPQDGSRRRVEDLIPLFVRQQELLERVVELDESVLAGMHRLEQQQVELRGDTQALRALAHQAIQQNTVIAGELSVNSRLIDQLSRQ